jgi:hypothetical protein
MKKALDEIAQLLARPVVGPTEFYRAAALLEAAAEVMRDRAATESMANVFTAAASIWERKYVETCQVVLMDSVRILIERSVPLWLLADGPAGLRVRVGVEALRARMRHHAHALFGPKAGAFLKWVHEQRLELEKEIEDGDETAG